MPFRNHSASRLSDQNNSDLENTELAFRHVSDLRLWCLWCLFALMAHERASRLCQALIRVLLEWRFPFAEAAVRWTLFDQFCGGVSLSDTAKKVASLERQAITTILDYSVEGGGDNAGLDARCSELIRAIEHANERITRASPIDRPLPLDQRLGGGQLDFVILPVSQQQVALADQGRIKIIASIKPGAATKSTRQ